MITEKNKKFKILRNTNPSVYKNIIDNIPINLDSEIILNYNTQLQFGGNL